MRKNVHYKLSESDREFLNRDNPLDFKIWQLKRQVVVAGGLKSIS